MDDGTDGRGALEDVRGTFFLRLALILGMVREGSGMVGVEDEGKSRTALSMSPTVRPSPPSPPFDRSDHGQTSLSREQARRSVPALSPSRCRGRRLPSWPPGGAFELTMPMPRTPTLSLRCRSFPVPVTIGIAAVNSSLYDVPGGYRAVMFDRFAGVKNIVRPLVVRFQWSALSQWLITGKVGSGWT